MSYYRPSFSQTAAMSRGRGGYSSRSSYRGSSNRGSSYRGGYRGGGNRSFDSSFSNSFSDSRSKYSGSDRYSGSRTHDDFRKPYRMDSGYGQRDSSSHHGGTPESKRPRRDAPSSRHENSYGSSGGYSGGGGGGGGGSSRYDSSYSNRRSFSSDRHQMSSSTPGASASFSRRPPSDFRRPSGMPPMSRGGGGYRGGGRISSRGGSSLRSTSSRGMKFRDRPPMRRRLLENSSYGVRKRIIPTRTTDYARRLKISKMRSAIAARSKKHSIDKDDSDEEKEDKTESKKEEDAAKMESDDEKEEKNTTITGQAKKCETKEKETVAGDKDAEKNDKSDTILLTNRKSFIKLNCPHCGIKAITFRKYEIHLQSRVHLIAMRKVAMKQKSILSQMRLAQRNAQNELEKTSDDLTPRTNYCPLCKLNYKQRKAVHQSSETHKNMKKFLMPFCKVCNITFTSPMIYESHCCSIEHLKRKQRVENGEESDDFGEEGDLDNFTTIDSVGVEENASEEDDKVDKKEPVNIGIEQIRKVESYYCDLCKMYLTRGSEEEMPAILARHCKQRTHMQRYIRYKEDKDLEKRAEKLQRKETAEKEVKKDKNETNGVEETSAKKANEDDETEKEEDRNKTLDDEEARDDKLWADVDKDLDDILAKEEGNKSSDEDEDVAMNERYDRFKYSEKNGDEKLKKEGENTDGVTDGKLSEVVEAK